MTVLAVEVAALLGLAVVGWLLAGPARGGAWRVLVALPLGIAAVTMVELLLLVTRTSVAYPWVALAVTVVASVAVAAWRGRNGPTPADGVVAGPRAVPTGRAALAGVVVLLAVAALTALVPLVNLTADSFRFIPSSQALSARGDLTGVSLFVMVTRGLVLPTTHGLAVTAFGYLRAVGPLLGIATAGLLWWLVQDGTRRLGDGLPRLLAIAAVALLVTNSRFLFSTFYLNTHVLFACWLLLLVTLVRSMLLQPQARTGARDAWLVGLLGAGLVLLRAEGTLLVAIAVAPLVLDTTVPLRRRQVVLVVVGVVVATWQFGMLLPRTFADPGAIDTAIIGVGVVGLALVAAAPLLGVVVPRLWRPLLLAHAAVWLGTLALALRDPWIVLKSAAATLENLTGRGLWGGSLLVLAVLVVGAVVARRVEAEQALVFPLATFVPFAVLLALLRDIPYRVGAGDSLNRMLLHVVPLAILVVALSAAGAARRRARPEPEPAAA